jgi:hypothetical protein
MLFTGNYYVGPNSNRWGQTTVAANGRKLNARNNISRTGHEWAHVTASFRYPGDSQILMINLWKGNQIPSDGIRVSYPYVTFEKIAN